jgi:hypothetical protein
MWPWVWNLRQQKSLGTRIWEWLCCQGPTGIVNYRPILSSERVPHISKPAVIKNLVLYPSGCLTPRQVDWLTISHNKILTLTWHVMPLLRWVWIRSPKPCELWEATRREPSVWAYNWATLFPGGYNYTCMLYTMPISSTIISIDEEYLIMKLFIITYFQSPGTSFPWDEVMLSPICCILASVWVLPFIL